MRVSDIMVKLLVRVVYLGKGIIIRINGILEICDLKLSVNVSLTERV